MNEKILVADDEKKIADLISYAFRREGYDVKTAYDGEEAIRIIEEFSPAVAIMDVMMPKYSGFDVCRRIDTKKIGIIMLTAKNDIVDKVTGLELGADDYITKPFDIREIMARAKSLIRRLDYGSREEESADVSIGRLKIDSKKRRVTVEEEVLELTPKEFELLYLLASNLQRVYTRDQLLDMVWGMEYAGGTRTVDIHVQRLRKKLGSGYEKMIQTVYRVGYKATGEFDEK